MRKIALILAAPTWIAFSAIADEGYKFHITVTDGRTGLKANPQFADLKIPVPFDSDVGVTFEP